MREPLNANDPETQRKANRLGWLLGLVVLIVVAAFMYRFSVYGWPIDADEYARQQQRESAEPADHHSTAPTTSEDTDESAQDQGGTSHD